MDLRGLLQDPQFRLGLGLLGASGPMPANVGFGQRLNMGVGSFDEWDRARLRQQLLEEESRQRAEEVARRNRLADMQIKRMQEQLDSERQADQFFANPANFMRATDVYSASDVGPDKQTVQAPLPQNELALKFIQSRNPQLARAGASALMREGETDKPIPIGKYLVDRNGNVIFAPPQSEDQAPLSPVGKLIADRNRLPAGHPDIARYDEAIKKSGEFAPPMPSFVLMQTDKGIVPVDVRTGKPAVEPIAQPPKKSVELKPIPPNIKTAIQENMIALKKVEDALALADASPQSFGAQNYLGDEVMQRKDPEGVDARAAISDIGSLKIHDRSGAAVSAAEFPRLKPFVPRATDTADTVRKKLMRFMNEYQMILDEQMNAYSEEQGYKPYQPVAQPQSATSNDGWSIRKK